DRDWRETRDELLKYKIEREQARRKFRPGDILPRLEAERIAGGLEPEAGLKAQPQAQTEDTRRRLKELMQQLQTVLEHY
ncbi:MAG: hypothetical protein ACREIK_08455, partial [Nitrospiraceae bacterium]